MKKKHNRNPIFEQAYNDGWKKGWDDAKNEAAHLFNKFLIERFETLDEVPGIGEKTKIKLHDHFMDALPKKGR